MNKSALQFKHVTLVFLLFFVALSLSIRLANAKPLTVAFVVNDTDWTSAAVGGIGGGNRQGGTGTIALTGVTGAVKQAFLYWHGMDNFIPRTVAAQAGAGTWVGGMNAGAVEEPPHTESCDGVYDVPTIFLNGNAVTGDALGDAETNCWGVGSSRAFRADVTAFVRGDGLYLLDRVTADECDDVNGASLVVLFQDDNPDNNRNLVFCEGNDSNLFFNFPGETDGWHATLPDIPFNSGKTNIQLHVADGQDLVGNGLDDDALTIAADGKSVVIPDIFGLYDGESVTNAGSSRGEALGQPGSLWDVHTFSISSIFTERGTFTLTLDGQQALGDCTGLVLAIVDLPAGGAEVSVRAASWGEVKAMYRE